MYKYLVIFSMLLALGQSIEIPQEILDYIQDLHNICVKQTGISEDDHAAYDVANNPHDPKLMCYWKCLMLEAKWMLPDGTIQYDFITDTAHPKIKDLLVAALNKCRQIDNGANLCEKASNFNYCMHQADPVNWIHI